MDIKTFNNIQFGARVVFPAKKDGVKPFVVVKNIQTTKRQSFNFNKQTKTPTKLFQKLLGLKKQVEFPSLKNDTPDIKLENPNVKFLNEKFYKKGEKLTIKFEFLSRIMLSKLQDSIFKSVNYKKKFEQATNINYDDFIKNFSKIKEHSPNQFVSSYALSRLLCANKEVEINLDTNRLLEHVKSDEACIFIMNHDRQKQDPKLLNFFNTLMSYSYILNNKTETAPKFRIILNRDIVDSFDEDKKILAEKWGAVGVDAAIHATNHLYNGRITAKLINELAKDKINLFIFPEGRMCAFSAFKPEWKFQSGIADIIIKTAMKKGKPVKVMPLGFAYKKKTGSIYMGEPLYFKEVDGKIKFTKGTVDEKLSAPELQYYVNNTVADSEGYLPILNNGEEVKSRNSSKYIAAILCDNLKVAKKEAAESIKNVGTELDTRRIYSVEEGLG